MKTIELNAVRMGILDIPVGFDEKFRFYVLVEFYYLDDKYSWSPFKLDNKNIIKDILEKLKNFEKMKWKDISGKNHHYLDYLSLSKKAKKELERIDVQEVFSFRLSGRNRLIGIRENECFYIIWWDSDHSFCPSNKKHT